MNRLEVRMLTNSPTFQQYFPAEHSNWTLAGVMWLLASGKEKYRAMIEGEPVPPRPPIVPDSQSPLSELAQPDMIEKALDGLFGGQRLICLPGQKRRGLENDRGDCRGHHWLSS